MLLLKLRLPQTSLTRFRHPSHSTETICSFCGERLKRDDGTPLLPVSQELTYWFFQFSIYCCDECTADGKLTYLVEIMDTIKLLEIFDVCINFDGHPIVNPSDVYIPIMSSSSGNLQFLCMSKKCSMKICCDSGSRETDLFHKSTIHGCVIDPRSGEIKIASVPISQIILGVNLLNQILRGEFPCSYIQPICHFHAECPNVSPRIRYLKPYKTVPAGMNFVHPKG
jgi:hypothetical protein